MQIEELLSFLDKTEFLNQIEQSKIPNINLYMDQALTFMNENLEHYKRNQSDKLITKSMINNYVKSGLIPKPENKKYFPQHMVALIYTFYLKQILPLDDAEIILHQYLDNHFNFEDINELYNEFLTQEKNEEIKLEEYLKTLASNIYDDSLSNTYDEDELTFLYIMLLSSKANTYKLVIEKLLDDIPKNKLNQTKRRIK
ncbi:MAG: DUF1836 domain-containing protein [Sedimentibacter sp.]